MASLYLLDHYSKLLLCFLGKSKHYYYEEFFFSENELTSFLNGGFYEEFAKDQSEYSRVYIYDAICVTRLGL
jgi:hypothetical protein